jgi:hypothetical protein
MQKYPYKEWRRLTGAPVEIRRNGTTVRAGTVEAVMPDSSLLWIEADGACGRELFAAANNYEVWTEPHLLDGNMRYRMTNSQLHAGTVVAGTV